MIFNGTSHQINILDKNQLKISSGSEFSLKDNIKKINILKTLDLNLELNIHTTNSINPYLYNHDGIDIYMSDACRIANIDFAPNFEKYSKIIVSNSYANKILEFCVCNNDFLEMNLEYLNKLYVVHDKVKKNGKVIWCTGIKKVFTGIPLETIYKKYAYNLEGFDLSELLISLMLYRLYNRSNNDYMNNEYVMFVNNYIKSHNINYDIHNNCIQD